jgi:hypothetical protein
MAKNQPEYEDKESSGLRNSGTLTVAETLRSVSAAREEAPAKEGKSDEKISVFWRVFGGTLLSIGALVVMTAYGGLSGSINDLRHELNSEIEKRADFARKDDLTSRSTAQWNAIKEVQNATGALSTVGDRVKVLDSQLDRVARICDEDRTVIKQNVAEQRKTAQEDKADFQRKLDDQRKTFDEERRELQRRFDDQRKTFDDERRELLTRVQSLSERLAAVEAITATSRSVSKVQPSITSCN